MPAQAALEASALFDQVITVVDEQPQLPGLAVEPDDGQVGFPQGRPSDGQSVDGVGLPPLPTAPAFPGHQPGRHPHRRLTGHEQVTFEPAGEVPTVLQGKQPLRPLPSPSDGLQVPVGRCRHRPLRQLAAGIVHCHQGMGALVRVDANDHHVSTSSDHTSWVRRAGRGHAFIEV